MSWRAGPEKPRTSFCWHCSRKFHGRAHVRLYFAGAEHDVHKACAREYPFMEVIYESSTSPAPKGKE